MPYCVIQTVHHLPKSPILEETGLGLDPYIDYSAVPGLVRNRAPKIVRLLRNIETGDPAEGIYQCIKR